MAQIKVIVQKTLANSGVTGTSYSDAVSLDGALTISAQAVMSSVTGLSGATAVLQISSDANDVTPSNWDDYGSSQNVTANGALFFEKINPTGNWIRLKLATNAGSFSASTTFVVKGPN